MSTIFRTSRRYTENIETLFEYMLKLIKPSHSCLLCKGISTLPVQVSHANKLTQRITPIRQRMLTPNMSASNHTHSQRHAVPLPPNSALTSFYRGLTIKLVYQHSTLGYTLRATTPPYSRIGKRNPTEGKRE